MQKLLGWLDKYLLEIGITLLLILIPLYPKLPLIDITHTWVYIRLEDFIVALVVGIWLIQLARRRVSLKTPLSFPIFAYWFVGGISLLYAIFVLRPHLAHFFPHLAILHYLRRLEYMILFFIVASTIKDVGRVKRYLFAAVLTLVGVCLYGFGQKFLGFPAFLTMNEEFAKGVPLYLPPTARITSTFAGHYDLAAYLVLMIAVLGSLIFGLKRWLLRIPLFALVFVSFILLLFTASRISFAVYLVTVSFMLYLQKKKWLIIPVLVASLFLMNYFTGASERFGKTLRVERVVYDVRTGKPIATVEEFLATPTPTPKPEEAEVALAPPPPPQPPAEESLPLGSGFLTIPIIEEEPETIEKPILTTPLEVATVSSEIATVSGEFLIKRAIVYDISFTTRFQAEWPRALEAFRRNRLLGSGYSSISLATDNDYLRLLGETGLLGFFTFLSILATFGLLIRQGLRGITSPFARSILIGVSAGLFGLMLNASLIDVFEASKVAYILWIFIGIATGIILLLLPKRRSLVKEAIEVARLPLTTIIGLCLLTPLVFGSALGNYFVGDDFTWLRWAVTSRMADIPQFFLDAQGFFYRPLAKIYFFLVNPIFGLRPHGYHLVDFMVHLGCAIGVYLLVLLITKKKFVSSLVGVMFLIHPINAESIFWISTTSHLFASLFYIWAFVAYIIWRKIKGGRRWAFYLFSLLVYTLGLASHERMVTFPLIIVLYDLVFNQFKKGEKWVTKVAPYLPFWILIDVYLWLRNVVAQAHGLSGDYNYNLQNLPFNFAGNLFGYLGELIASFHFIPFYDLARSSLRAHKFIVLGLLIIGFLVIKKLSKRLKLTRVVIFSLGWFIILLLPFLGLGNIAERYVYPAHLGFFILMALFINWIYERLKKQNLILSLSVTTLIIGGILGFYQFEMEKAKQNWHQAGEIANKILLALSSNYPEFSLGAGLHFVDLPIRHGRAWVFPVGIEDGLWFIYRDESLIINVTTDLEKTLDLVEERPYDHVFVYEEGELKEARR